MRRAVDTGLFVLHGCFYFMLARYTSCWQCPEVDEVGGGSTWQAGPGWGLLELGRGQGSQRRAQGTKLSGKVTTEGGALPVLFTNLQIR